MRGLVRPGDHVLGTMLARPNAGRVQGPVQMATLVDDAGDKHLGQQTDEPTAAEALGLGAADDAITGFGVLAINPHPLDGAARGAHAVLHAGTLKSRAGRARAGDQPRAVAQHHLAVGADVDEQCQVCCVKHAAADDAGANVGAHVTRHPRQAIHRSFRIDVQANLGGLDRGHLVDRRHVWL